MKIRTIVFCLLAFLASGCGYNDIQTKDEAVSAASSQLMSIYKKRADLIPSLVNVVKGYAAHEEQVFTDVAEARAKAGQITLPADATPEQMQEFANAQRAVGSSLSRLIAVAEAYPQLKADGRFADLQASLERIETQAAGARNKYIRAIQDYNTTVRRFPTNLTAKMFGSEVKQQVQFDDPASLERAPEVKF